MNVDRLNKLADYLDTVPPDRFDINMWGYVIGGPEPSVLDMNVCGTAACAVGWACSIPEFQEAGLRLEHDGDDYAPVYKGLFGFKAAGAFFDLTGKEARWLFAASSYPLNSEGEHRDVPPLEVAQRIRDFIRDGELPDAR